MRKWRNRELPEFAEITRTFLPLSLTVGGVKLEYRICVHNKELKTSEAASPAWPRFQLSSQLDGTPLAQEIINDAPGLIYSVCEFGFLCMTGRIAVEL